MADVEEEEKQKIANELGIDINDLSLQPTQKDTKILSPHLQKAMLLGQRKYKSFLQVENSEWSEFERSSNSNSGNHNNHDCHSNYVSDQVKQNEMAELKNPRAKRNKGSSISFTHSLQPPQNDQISQGNVQY